MATNLFIISAACIALVLSASNAVEGAIGINWGRQSAQRLLPSQVVDLLLQNGVKHARIYTSQVDVMQAFAGSGINLIVSIFDTKSVFNTKTIGTMDGARAWVQAKAPYFIPSNIRTIFFGNYFFYVGITDKTELTYNINALQILQNAINEAGYGDQVKATTLHITQQLKPNITKPSDAEFKDEIKEEIAAHLRFLKQNNAPFVIEMFPIVDLDYISNLDPSFAFADNESSTVITDINGSVYTNIFEFVYDSFVWALRKAGTPDLEIVVSQIGWPTDGDGAASISIAQYFYKCLLPLVANNKGTPLRPGKRIDVFVHELTDENRMPYLYPWSRHWGIYRSNGEPKYKIDLSGQGRDIYPTSIRGIMRMPARWCMFNGNMSDFYKVEAMFNFACQQSDCTSLAPGGTCGNLSYKMNISYAFNMHFQFQFQDEEACVYDGLGYVSVDDPSTELCVFPVEVVRGRQDNFFAQLKGEGFRGRPNNVAIFVFLLSILVTLFWDTS